MDKSQFTTILTPRNVCDPVQYEPRLLFDVVTFDGSSEYVDGNSEIFVNGEKYTLRLTHILAAMLYSSDGQQSPVGGDERMIQRYGLRINGHDEYYMNGDFPVIAGWDNVTTGASDIVTQANSVWELEKPVIMGKRDSFEVEVQLIVAPESGSDRVTVSFMGRGLFSRQPKMITGFVNVSDTLSHTIPATDLINDALEPLEIYKVVINDAPPNTSLNPVGNVRNVRVRIRQNGNGTNQWWVRGPQITVPNDRAPAPLFGLTAGRAVVHRIPAPDGWLLGSGEGINIKLRSYQPSRIESVCVAMAGYIQIT